MESEDATRVAVWGDRIGGGIALAVAAVDDRVAAVIVQVPAFGEEILPADDDGTWFAAIKDVLLGGDLESFDKEVIGPRPVVSVDQDAAPSLLPTLTSFHWFIEYGARYGTKWENRATYELLDTPRPFESQPCVAHVAAPCLMVVGRDEEMPAANSDVARHCFEITQPPKELFEIDGGHFGLLYHDSPEYETSVEVQQDFLQRRLLNQGVPPPSRSPNGHSLRLTDITGNALPRLPVLGSQHSPVGECSGMFLEGVSTKCETPVEVGLPLYKPPLSV